MRWASAYCATSSGTSTSRRLREQPTHVALRVARQPPVFHLRRLGFFHGRGRGSLRRQRLRVAGCWRALACHGGFARIRRQWPKDLRRLFGSRRPHQQLHLGVAGQQIKTLRFAARKQMHGKVVAQCCRGRHGIVFALRGKLHKPVVRLLVDHGSLFNPADLVLVGLDLEKALGRVPEPRAAARSPPGKRGSKPGQRGRGDRRGAPTRRTPSHAVRGGSGCSR